MYLSKLIDKMRRNLRANHSSRTLRRPQLLLEALETRTVPTVVPPAPYPPLNGLVTVISDTGPDGEVSIKDFNNQLATIDNANISGVALQIQWREIEPNLPTGFNVDWSRIDAVFKDAKRATNADGSKGKPVELLISAGFWSPQWVLDSAKTAPFQPQYNNPKDHSLGQIPLPVPWDNPVYYNAWFGFLKMVKDKYEANPLFRSIGAAGPTSVSAEATLPNSTTRDPGTPPPGDHHFKSDLKEWKHYGYRDYGFAPGTKSSLVTAWDQVFQFYANTFPKQYVTLSTGGGISNPKNDPQFTLKQLIADGSTIVNDFQGQFSVQSDSLSGGTTGDKQAYPVHQLVIGNAGVLTTGFQTSDSDQKLGAPGNLPLSLALVIQNGMRLNTKGDFQDPMRIVPATGQHVNYIELFARDVEPAHVNAKTYADVQAVLKWGASLFDDPHTLSVFADWTIADENITVDTDADGGPKLTIDGHSVSFPAGQITSINIYNTESAEPLVNQYFTELDVKNTNVPITISDLPTPLFNFSTDRVTIGNRSDGLQGINAPVRLTNSFPTIFSSPMTDLIIDDAADRIGRTFFLDSNELNVFPGTVSVTGAITWDNINVRALTLDGSSAGSTYVVNGTAAPTTIKAGMDDDTFAIAPGAETFGNMSGALTVDGGGGNNALIVDDQADTRNGTFTVANRSIQRTGSAAVTYKDIGAVTINGGNGNVTYNVKSTVAFTPITIDAGTGNNTINVGNADNLDDIQGALTVHGQGGTDTLNINDQAATDPQTYSLFAGTLTRLDTVTGKVTGTITFGSSISSLIVHGGSGGNAFKISTMPAPKITLNGGAGTNSLTGPDVANTWVIDKFNAGTLNSTVNFRAMANLIGGSGVDRFEFQSAGTIRSIDGGGAPTDMGDWLDYSEITTKAVTVNLATGSATNVHGGAGAVTNIMNVYGGNDGGSLTGNSTGNILVGGAGVYTITGGSGRSILIAGKGTAQIFGGSGGSSTGGDIMIGGYTSYDTDTTRHMRALMALLAEWQSADSYATRFTKIDTGIPGGYKLNFGGTVNSASVSDTLTAATGPGNPAVDWFFGNFTGSSNDTIVNYETGEHKNDK